MNPNVISEYVVGDSYIKSPLVRRLVCGGHDPVRRRVRRWLAEMDDEKLLRLGLNGRDRAALRTSREDRLQ
jgi:hypothetical protein